MDKIKVERTAFVLDSKEIEKMLEVYRYVRHRSTEHAKSGAAKVFDVRYLDYVIAKLQEEDL